jgi:hypothetical protein
MGETTRSSGSFSRRLAPPSPTSGSTRRECCTLEVSGARSKTKLWEDDTAGGLEMKLGKGGKAQVASVANKKPGGEGQTVQRTKITFGSDSEEDDGASDGEYDELEVVAPL